MTKKRPLISEFNVETNEIVIRDMSDSELAQYEAEQTERAKAQAEAEAKAAARQAIVQRLGLTADELAVLLG